MKKHVALVAGLAASLLACAPALSASAVQSSDQFEVLSLTLDNGVATDSDNLTGDDNGFVALNGNDLINTGDDGVGVFSDLASLNPEILNNLSIEDGTFLFTDLKTQTSKMFERTFSDASIFALTGITTVDSAGDPVGSTVSLSSDISFDMNDADRDCVFLASGYGRVALWNFCSGVVWDINTESGDVSILNEQALEGDYSTFGPESGRSETNGDSSSGFAQGGIVEYVGGKLRFVLTAVDDYDNDETVGIYRYVPSEPTTAPELVLEFTSPGIDLYNFTASTLSNQWCGHTEDAALLPAMDGLNEPVFCADASFSTTPAPAPEPELANTGVDFSGMGIAGITALGVVAAGAMLLARRREATK